MSLGKRSSGKKIEGKDMGKDQKQVVPAGTQAWRKESKLLSGGSLSQMSKVRIVSSVWPHFDQVLTLSQYDSDTGLFSQKVNIQHDDAFVLNTVSVTHSCSTGHSPTRTYPDRSPQLLMTEGPLKGKHVLVLDPIEPFFFLDFPAEIRLMIYRLLMVESKPIRLTTYTPPFGTRRSVRSTFDDRRAHSKDSYRFSKDQGKYLDQPPSNFALARVSKQIAAEAAPVIYGDNTFAFEKLSEMGVFINRIGVMSKHVKHLAVVGYEAYTQGKGRAIFNQLSSATNLRDLGINYRAFCKVRGHLQTGGRVSIQKFVEDARPSLRKLEKQVSARNKDEGHDENVLNIVRPTSGEKCRYCSRDATNLGCFDARRDFPSCKSQEEAAFMDGVGHDLRDAIAKELRIKD